MYTLACRNVPRRHMPQCCYAARCYQHPPVEWTGCQQTRQALSSFHLFTSIHPMIPLQRAVGSCDGLWLLRKAPAGDALTQPVQDEGP